MGKPFCKRFIETAEQILSDDAEEKFEAAMMQILPVEPRIPDRSDTDERKTERMEE